MAATLDPKLIGGGTKKPYQTTKATSSNPVNNAITAAVQAAKPVAVPSLPGMNSQKTVPSVTPAATVQKSPTTTAAPATAAPKTTVPTTGALDYNTATPVQKKAMTDNWARLNSDSDYLASEIARAQAKIAAPGTSAQDASAANDYLTKLTGISAGAPQSALTGTGSATATNNFGLPSDLSWLGANASNEVASQIAAYQAQQEAAKQAAQFGVDQNNQYLQEQIDSLNRNKAVDLDQLQQTQNRFGGLYSGGLNYQGGQINSSYANQQGALSRDIASRNQQLLDQYGTQANQIAQNIQQLQANEPSIIRDRINDYLNQYAGIYGYNPLNPNQSTLQGKQANWGAAMDVANQTGYNVTPQNDWSGYFRQVNTGVDAQGNPITQTAQQQQQQWQNNFNQQQFQTGVDQDIYDRLYQQANANTQTTDNGPSVTTISTNINRALSALGNNVSISDPTVRNQIDQIILTQTQDPSTIAQLYAMYGIPIPADLQAELSGK